MAVSMPVTPYLAQASRAPRPEGLPFADWAAQWPVWSWLARFVRVWPSIVLRMPFLFSTPALEQDLEIDHASLRMLQDARAAAREAMISAAAAEAQALTRAAERATARAQHVQEYYKTWAAAVLKEQANKKSTGAQGVAGASPPPTAVTVPRAMDLAASIAARDRVRCVAPSCHIPRFKPCRFRAIFKPRPRTCLTYSGNYPVSLQGSRVDGTGAAELECARQRPWQVRRLVEL